MWNNAIDGIAHRHAPSFAFALPPLLPPPSPPSPLAFGDCVAALRCACSSRTSSSEAAFFDATPSTDDGIVNAADLSILLSQWGGGANSTADLNHDGIVGAQDISLLLDGWGVCP